MKAILVFIDGTTCDMRHRIDQIGTAQFFEDTNIRNDIKIIKKTANEVLLFISCFFDREKYPFCCEPKE